MNKSLRYLVACVATIGVVGSPMMAPAYAEPFTDPTVTVVPEPVIQEPSLPTPPAPPAVPQVPVLQPVPVPTPPAPVMEPPASPPSVQEPQVPLLPVDEPEASDSTSSDEGTVSSPGDGTNTSPAPPVQSGGATVVSPAPSALPELPGAGSSESDQPNNDVATDAGSGNETPTISGKPDVTEGSSDSSAVMPSTENKPDVGTEQGSPPPDANAGGEATEVSVVEAPKPDAALPVPEAVRALKPEVVTVAAISDDDDEVSGLRPPKPGRDQVVRPDHDDDKPPATPNIVVNGDNNTINIINIVDSEVGNINQDVSNNDRFIVVRNLDHPGHDLRFPVRPNHPIQLPSNWCGGQSGAWAYAGVGFGPGGGYVSLGAGVFHSNGNCGYNPRPPRPQHWPSQMVICPPAGYVGHPQRYNHYTFIDNRTIFVNNTFVKGDLVVQQINGAPQQVFVYEGSSPDLVYQAPSQVPPKWMGFQGYEPLGENPGSSENETVVATDNRIRNATITVTGIVVFLVVGTTLYLASRKPRHEG
jgi:hypothetical protein